MAEIVFQIDEEKVIRAEKVQAFRGAHKRVFLKEDHAVIDLATTELAQRFLSKVAQPGQGVTYVLLLEMAQRDPELFELTAVLARYKTARGS